jgi:hypothetical protein
MAQLVDAFKDIQKAIDTAFPPPKKKTIYVVAGRINQLAYDITILLTVIPLGIIVGIVQGIQHVIEWHLED